MAVFMNYDRLHIVEGKTVRESVNVFVNISGKILWSYAHKLSWLLQVAFILDLPEVMTFDILMATFYLQ